MSGPAGGIDDAVRVALPAPATPPPGPAGPGPVFRADAHQMLRKELELLGGRCVTRAEIFETLDLVACGEV
jgi:hypothetical protein